MSSRLRLKRYLKSKHVRVLGPSMSGKTTFLRYLQHGQFVAAEPTINMEISKIRIKDLSLIVWDFYKHGKSDMKPGTCIVENVIDDANLKSLVASQNTMDAIIYIVDASDPGRLKIAHRGFQKMLKLYHRVSIIMIIGTKTDLPTAVSKNYISEKLHIPEIVSDRECGVFMISNVTGEGIEAAADWLYSKINHTEGYFWSNIIQKLSFSKLECWLPGFGKWDPFSACRYSRLT